MIESYARFTWNQKNEARQQFSGFGKMNSLILAYEAISAGGLPKHIERKKRSGHYDGKEEELRCDVHDIYRSLHKVFLSSKEESERKMIMGDARLNPSYLSCTCKGHHKSCACSHILCAGHLLGVVDVHRMSAKIKVPRGKIHKPVSGRRIQPASSGESDSSSEAESDGDM